MSDATDLSLSANPQAWQEKFIDRLLIMWAGMGALALLVSISRTTLTGWLPIYSAQIGLLALTLALTLFRARFSATFKAGCAISFNLAVGTTGVYFLGLLSGGVWFFPVAVLLLALFASRKLVIWLSGAIGVFLVLVAFGHISGHLQLPAPADLIATSANQWAVHFMASAFFFASLMMMVTYYQRSTNELVREIRQQRDEIARLANFDSLTGLPVSRLANDRLDVACRHAERASGKVALLFIDLDGFKAVNDVAGHEAGDHCLRIIAGRLSESVRIEDTVSRVGGDEFVVIIGKVKDRLDIAQLAAKLVAAIGVPIEWQGQAFTLGASIGIALFPNDGDDRESLMRRADQAMYAVKRSGKNTYAFAGEA